MKKLRHPTLVFFLAAALLRIPHALSSFGYHICGDIGLPWLMANDWEHTPNHRYFWGQSYLGAQETWAFSKAAHLFFATIPTWLAVIAGQLLALAGATLLFDGLRRIKPGFGQKPLELGAAVLLLGFAVPSLQKYSFGIGSGYSLAPLAAGLAVWLWAIAVEKDGRPRDRDLRLALLLCGGVLFGLMQSVIRLNLIPGLALLACLGGTALASRPRRSLLLGASAFCVGVFLGFLPELWIGVERNEHASIVVFPLIDRIGNLLEALNQTGVFTGILPYVATTPEDALWFRGHTAFRHDYLDAISVIVFVGLVWSWRRSLRDRRTWILWAIVAVNLLLIMFSGIHVETYSARRYSFPLSFAVSALLLLHLDHLLSQGAVALRAVVLAVYLYSSVAFHSPLEDVRGILAQNGFVDATDCLSGTGGDLSAVQVLNSHPYHVISHRWRLVGNYSRAIDPTMTAKIRQECAKVFHVDTGEMPIEEIAPYCPHPKPIYEEPANSWTQSRPPIRLFRC